MSKCVWQRNNIVNDEVLTNLVFLTKLVVFDFIKSIFPNYTFTKVLKGLELNKRTNPDQDRKDSQAKNVAHYFRYAWNKKKTI